MLFIFIFIFMLLNLTILKDINLLMILVVFTGLRKGLGFTVLIGALIGLLVDIFSITTFGLNIFLYSLIGFLVYVVKAHILYKEDVFMDIVFTFTSVCLFYFLYFIFTRSIQVSIFHMALFSSIISPFIFRACEKKITI
ncbi:MAG: rod shape-determining protein MreD [Candidatus Omnitrophota bacterium]